MTPEIFNSAVRTFRRNAPAIETGIGVGGLVGMAGVAADPNRARDLSQSSPVGIDAIAQKGNDIGLSDQATFSIITIFIAAAAMHGIWRLRRRKRRQGGV